MKNVILSCFPAAFSLESFLLTVNLKLDSKSEEDRLKEVLKRLSPILIAFDFELKGPYRSYVDRRFTYEQLLYLCCLKINESKMPAYENHMLKSTNLSALQSISQNLSNQKQEVERKLLATENLSILYFLDKNGDGALWRELHALVGSSIMKYLFIYGFMFKLQHGTPSTYIQISGTKFNYAYKNLVTRKLAIDEKAIASKSSFKKRSNPPENKVIVFLNIFESN